MVSPLKPLHPDEALIASKLAALDRLTTGQLVDSLRPGQVGALKARPDGTMLDGHHRIKLLRNRGVNVDALPREVIPKDAPGDAP
jgi:hypothetical protein